MAERHPFQWRFGLPQGLTERLEWRTYGALQVGIVNRRDLVCFKLYASADQTGPDNVHVRDLLALKPDGRDYLGETFLEAFEHTVLALVQRLIDRA